MNLKNLLALSVSLALLTSLGLAIDSNTDIPGQAGDLSEQNYVNSIGAESGETSVELKKLILEVDKNQYQPGVLENAGAEIKHEYGIIDAVAVEVPKQAAGQMENIRFVERVEEDRDTELILPSPDDNEGELPSQEEEDESDGENQGENITVAVLDTGIDNEHQDFEGRIADNQDFTGDGYQDRHGHGTHVAGIVAGDGDYPGIATEALLKNVKVLDDEGSGRMSDAIAGVDYAVENNADIIVMSLGAQTDNCDGSDMLSESVDNAVDNGVAVTVSSGNSGPDSDTLTIPGCAEKAFTVGATDSNGESIASYSSRGPTSDDRIKPDIAAPGTNIMAAEAGTEDSYTSKTGTSMAAPYAAGTISLMIQENPGLSPIDYYESIQETAIDLGEDETIQGYGKINKTAVLNHMENGGTQQENNDDETTQEEEAGNDETSNETNGQETRQEPEEGDLEEETSQERIEEQIELEEQETRQENNETTRDQEREPNFNERFIEGLITGLSLIGQLIN